MKLLEFSIQDSLLYNPYGYLGRILSSPQSKFSVYINPSLNQSSTYDHRVWKTGLPVRSAVLKPHAGWLVVWWVTTCESQLLYVFGNFFFPPLFDKYDLLKKMYIYIHGRWEVKSMSLSSIIFSFAVKLLQGLRGYIRKH